MFTPSADGRIRPVGSIAGGHAVLAYKVAVKTLKREVPQVWLHNSWGKYWGLDGRCYLTFDDLEKLLIDDGECCIPMRRARVR